MVIEFQRGGSRANEIRPFQMAGGPRMAQDGSPTVSWET